MNGTRQQALAGPGLALQQDRRHPAPPAQATERSLDLPQDGPEARTIDKRLEASVEVASWISRPVSAIKLPANAQRSPPVHHECLSALAEPSARDTLLPRT